MSPRASKPVVLSFTLQHSLEQHEIRYLTRDRLEQIASTAGAKSLRYQNGTFDFVCAASDTPAATLATVHGLITDALDTLRSGKGFVPVISPSAYWTTLVTALLAHADTEAQLKAHGCTSLEGVSRTPCKTYDLLLFERPDVAPSVDDGTVDLDHVVTICDAVRNVLHTLVIEERTLPRELSATEEKSLRDGRVALRAQVIFVGVQLETTADDTATSETTPVRTVFFIANKSDTAAPCRVMDALFEPPAKPALAPSPPPPTALKQALLRARLSSILEGIAPSTVANAAHEIQLLECPDTITSKELLRCVLSLPLRVSLYTQLAQTLSVGSMSFRRAFYTCCQCTFEAVVASDPSASATSKNAATIMRFIFQLFDADLLNEAILLRCLEDITPLDSDHSFRATGEHLVAQKHKQTSRAQ